MNRRIILSTLVAGTLGALAGAALWNWYAAAPDAMTDAGDRRVLYWHDPMVPGPKFEKPGKSPFMDMQLVPVYADEAAASDDGSIAVAPQVIQTLGVRTAPATRAAEPRRLTAPGFVVRDASGVAVLVDIIEPDAAWLRKGLSATVRVAAAADRGFEGEVDYVSPDIDVGARSFKVRVRLAARDPALKANAPAEVTITGPRPPRGQLLIPREALIRTGTRTAVVLALPQGRFKPVEVIAGSEIGDRIEIVKGLNEGDTVVVSGQFLIDSEASVRASFERMQAPPQDGATP